MPSQGLVDPGALAALGTIDVLLSTIGSEGVVPEDPGVVGDLRSDIESAIAEVRQDAVLPAEVKQVLVARLHDMLWALDHLEVAGPDGVKAAAERLAGALAINPEARKYPTTTKVTRLTGRAWSVFTAGQKASGAIEGWSQVLEALPELP